MIYPTWKTSNPSNQDLRSERTPSVLRLFKGSIILFENSKWAVASMNPSISIEDAMSFFGYTRKKAEREWSICLAHQRKVAKFLDTKINPFTIKDV